MATPSKRLFLVVITLLLGMICDGAMAQPTNYDFSQTFSLGGSSSIYQLNGTFTADAGTGLLSSWSNVTFGLAGTPLSLATVTGGNFDIYHSAYDSSSGRLMANFIFTSAYGNPPSGGTQWGFVTGQMSSNWPGGTVLSDYTTGNISENNIPAVSAQSISASSLSAPEIDGSLAPKVGFLLGCLFLMFGRKKQNTEALMTA